MGMKSNNQSEIDDVKRKSEEVDPSQKPSQKKVAGGMFDLKAKALQAGSQAVGKAISGLYKKLEAEGFSAGEEFVVAIKEGLALSPPATIVLGDRDVDVTLQRLTEALSKAQELADPDEIASCYLLLSETYQKVGDTQNTMKYFELYQGIYRHD